MNTAELRERFPALTIDAEFTEPYMDEVLVEVERRGLLDRFLSDIGDWLLHGDRRATLYKDFAPLSFTFQWYLPNRAGEYEKWLFGGFIFHEAGDSGVSAPTFSVVLGGARETGWYTHT